MHTAQRLAFQYRGTAAERLVLQKLAADLAAGKASSSVLDLKRSLPPTHLVQAIPAIETLRRAGIIEREHLETQCRLNVDALAAAVRGAP